MSSAAVQTHAPVRDPYALHPDEVTEAPKTLGSILKRIGPGLILSASIVGSGELIATTTLGAEVGYVALWIILLSCVIKPAVQSEIGRYVIATGETGAEGFNHVPGPRLLGVNWIIWAWAFMVLVTFFQIGAMFGGVAQVLNQIWPSVPMYAWISLELAISLILLLGGHYERIEKLATIKVGLFTMLTFLCAVLLMSQRQYFHPSDLAKGFMFQLPGNGLATAIAVFGITGVGAAELFMYPYWCVEKGYARFAGKRDGSPAWNERARGWVRVMNVDILASMIVYTVATIAFYLLGAGILHSQGLVPAAKDMIPVLSRMYTTTLGPWALWLFYAGALATLYGTIFAATAGNSRVYADMFRLMKGFDRTDYAARCRVRNRVIWVHLIVPCALIIWIGSPVEMVKWGGVAQALMLPVIAVGTLYLRHKRLPQEVAPSKLVTVGLWVTSLLIIAVMCWYAVLILRPAH
ncbi:MAG TPA: Nramp family divalent metal transporter [Bryobacteraceae bacterium]|jgi:Mn2+/Fe2+ NRAMP family transporter|nr:Nramp family divalent metal transporter [Bryobacteraceae bacterium]